MRSQNLVYVLSHLKKYVEEIEDHLSTHILLEFCKDPYGVEFSYFLMEAGAKNHPKPFFSLIEKGVTDHQVRLMSTRITEAKYFEMLELYKKLGKEEMEIGESLEKAILKHKSGTLDPLEN